MNAYKTLRCPAKLNLFLEIRGKRNDGYHELGTLFAALEWGDTLRAESWDRIEIIDDAVPGPMEQNLIYKAAALLQTRFSHRIRGGIRFTLEKRIPMGAGLGGGSSDAAAALRLADAIWGLGLTPEQLATCACELGSDVPFFLFPSHAFAEGRGEILSPAPAPFPFHIVVATPPCHVDTAGAYRRFQGQPYGRQWPTFKTAYAARRQDPAFYASLHNDFEAIVAEEYPEIKTVRELLNRHDPEKVLLTGSGASLFALFQNQDAAATCLETVKPHCRFAVVTRFLSPDEIHQTL